MNSNKSEQRGSFLMKIAFRVFINVGLVWFLNTYFRSFFVLEGGFQAIAVAGLTLTVLNAIVVPILRVLSLPIKFIAWAVAFLLVNAAALWLTIRFISMLDISGVSLAIEGIVGWVLVSIFLGLGNWLVRAIVK